MGFDTASGRFDTELFLKRKYGTKVSYKDVKEYKETLDKAWCGKLAMVTVPDMEFGQVPTFVPLEEARKMIKEGNPNVTNMVG